ncbi:MAG: hypothetical protein ACI9Y7_000060 [Dokdonia sp.]|jgi:hypothetical protein
MKNYFTLLIMLLCSISYAQQNNDKQDAIHLNNSLENQANKDGDQLVGTSTTQGYKIQTSENSPLIINDLLTASKNYVAINTTYVPQEYRLAVGGKVLAEGVRIELQKQWPDYVFANDYQLKTIEEVSAFIQDNGHLPNVPAAATIETEGIDLGEMQVIQMEKIEELTLYIISLKKEIDLLKTKIED